MSELTDHEARELAGSMRPPRRPLLLAAAINFVMAALLFGVPYIRGRLLAKETRTHYVSFVQCMLGGHPAETPGLSLPRGEREHYAAKVLFANADWPMSCRPLLKRLRPPDAIFLWPSVKATGADLRDVIEKVDRELITLAKRRTASGERVPQRPLDLIKRLQAATVLFVRAADVASDIDNDSVVLDENIEGLAEPARLPLMIGEARGLLPWSDAGVLELLAFDTHNLAYLHVEDGKVARHRMRRNIYLRGVSRSGRTPYLVWAMPEARCAEREDRCTRRPTGLAVYDTAATEPQEPSWKLPGHPAERLDRALSISETGRVDFLRRSSARGGVEWLRTHLPDALSAPSEQKPRKLAAENVWSIVEAPDEQVAANHAEEVAADGDMESSAGTRTSANTAPTTPHENKADPKPSVATVPTSAVLIPGEPAAVLRATETSTGVEASLTLATQPTQALALEGAAGKKPWAVACASSAERWLAYGTSTELRVARFVDGQVDPDHHSDERVQPLSTQACEIGAPLDPDDPGADRLQLLCEAGRAQLLFVGGDRKLRQVHCDAHGCAAASELAENVAEFDAVLNRGLGLVAFQQGLLTPTVKLLQLNEQFAPVGAPTVPGACWEPLGGMCGRPTLLIDAQRVALLTRDGPDMLAIETVNNGRTFSPLSGVGGKRTFDSSTTSPLQQHRIRKGID